MDVHRARLRGPGEVAEDEARGAVADAYARLRGLLGVPFVPTVFRMLGRHERYLTACVDAFEPLLAGGAGERAASAQRERAAALASEVPPAAVDAGPEVAALLERYNAANPLSVLLVQTLAGDRVPPADGVMDRAPGPAGALLDDVRACHGGFTVPGMWRELDAEAPAVAAACWAQVRALAGGRPFLAARDGVVALAREAGRGATVPDPADAGLDADACRNVDAILARFGAIIPSMVVEIEYVRAAVAAV